MTTRLSQAVGIEDASSMGDGPDKEGLDRVEGMPADSLL